MIRSIIPLIAVLLFFLEPVFSLFSPMDIGGTVIRLFRDLLSCILSL